MMERVEGEAWARSRRDMALQRDHGHCRGSVCAHQSLPSRDPSQGRGGSIGGLGGGGDHGGIGGGSVTAAAQYQQSEGRVGRLISHTLRPAAATRVVRREATPARLERQQKPPPLLVVPSSVWVLLSSAASAAVGGGRRDGCGISSLA